MFKLMPTPLRQILICAYKDEMIAFLEAHPEYLQEAFTLAISDEPRFSWRAAWLLWSCLKENDPRIQDYIKDIVNSVGEKADNHQRELLKIISLVDLDDESEGFLFDTCMTIWEQIHKQPSVRITAFKFIIKMAKKYPDLAHEIGFLTQERYLDTLSPGIREAVSRMIKETPSIVSPE